jgi:hypothetical protein
MLASTIDATHRVPFTPVSADGARAAIAACLLGEEPEELRVGDITLHPHQRSAVTRIRRTLSMYGGALLCDDVGLGKTYVALALAASYDSVAIVAPATLFPMWHHALATTHLTAEFISVESLGRSGPPQRKRALIIVDEAHHFRNPCTRRYATLARMCMLTPVVFLTATPLHNSRDDLSALVALFRGSGAYSMSDGDLASITVRRDATDGFGIQNIPVVEHRPPRVLVEDEGVLDMIRALPAPVPPSDGSVAANLVILGLVRQWVSSNAALIGALKRRIARSNGLLASLDAGRYPTTAELSAWVYTGDAVQLAFAELLVPAQTSLVELAAALREHVAALGALLSVARHPGDAQLTDFVREIRATHPNEKLVAFSCYAETAEALYASLKRDGHVALLTARGATIASGPTSRQDLMDQFGPDSVAACSGGHHQEVNLLIATDLLSEGVNLQEASVLIHLDVPWTSARIEQRIGRLARMGSRHQRVASYSVNPPPRAEAFLRELEIVTHKSSLSAQLFGDSPNSSYSEKLSAPPTIASTERVREIMEQWRRPSQPACIGDASPVVAVMHAPQASAIGAWIVDDTPILMAWTESEGLTTDAASIGYAIDLAGGAGSENITPPDTTQISSVLRAASAWYDQRCAWRAVDGSSDGFSGPIGARRALSRVADATLASASFARRAESATLSTRLRNAPATPLPLAVEWSLESLTDNADKASVNTILDLVDQARLTTERVRPSGIHCVALILGVPETIELPPGSPLPFLQP